MSDQDLVLVRFKQGTTVRFPPIVVSVASESQDLTADGWSVRCFIRPDANSRNDPIVPAIDETAKTQSTIIMSLTPTQTRSMGAQFWFSDVEVTGPEIGQRKSKTYMIEVEQAVTR